MGWDGINPFQFRFPFTHLILNLSTNDDDDIHLQIHLQIQIQIQIQLKTLTVVLKNLIDPAKGGIAGEGGLKYRTLKVDNPKLKARLFCSSNNDNNNNNNDNNYVMELLTNSALVGMTRREHVLVMDEAPSDAIRDVIGLRVLPAFTNTISKIASTIENNNNNKNNKNNSNSHNKKKAKLTTAEQNNSNNSNVNNAVVAPTEKLSEKQIARRELEEKKRREREADKVHRKQTRAQIAADKLVRETDPNWKPAVSAAADKTGTGLQSFRDRHGECNE